MSTERMSTEREQHWLKKLAWFVMEHMSTTKPFNEAFAKRFDDNDVVAFDLLTDDLFPALSVIYKGGRK